LSTTTGTQGAAVEKGYISRQNYCTYSDPPVPYLEYCPFKRKVAPVKQKRIDLKLSASHIKLKSILILGLTLASKNLWCQFESEITVDGISYTLYDTTYAWHGSEDDKVLIYLQADGFENETGPTRGYYLNGGELYCRGEMQRGVHVLQTTWYQGGKKGPVYEFDRQGMINGIWPDTLIAGKNYSLYGIWITPDESSIKIYIETSGYDEGTGDLVGVYPNGQQYCTAELKNHYLCNYFESWYPDGSLQSHGAFHEAGLEDTQEQEIYEALGNPGISSMRIGWWEWFYPNGTLMASGEFNERGLKKGTWNWYYDNTDLKAELSFSNFSFVHISLKKVYQSVPEKYVEYYPGNQPKVILAFNVQEILEQAYWYATDALISRKTYYENGLPCDDEVITPFESKSWCRDGTLYYFQRDSDSTYFYEEPANLTGECYDHIEPFIPIYFEYVEQPPFRHQPKYKF
jgi:antitoxin component YwqK of YwqJK toxin-antitoxin module